MTVSVVARIEGIILHAGDGCQRRDIGNGRRLGSFRMGGLGQCIACEQQAGDHLGFERYAVDVPQQPFQLFGSAHPRPGHGPVSALNWSATGSHLAFGTEEGFAALVDFTPR